MKILLITDTHNPKAGGAEKYFFSLKNELKKRKHAVYSLGFGPKNEKGSEYRIIKETRFLFFRHFWRLFCNPVKYFEIKKYIRKINPDVIHLHNINKYTISLLRAVKGYRIVQTVHDYGLVCPTLWNVHNDLKPCPTGMRFGCIRKHRRDYRWPVYLSMLWFFYKRNRLLKKRVSTFIAPSPQLDEYLEKNNFRNVMFIPNFIGITKARPVFDRIIKNQILYAGLLERNKGVSKLIEAMKEVVGKFKSAELKIAGSGSQEKQLRNLAKKLGLEKHVSFLGWVADIDRLYEQSAVIVVPSIWIENAPVTIQEAMLHSRPVIGSNRGGIPWLVEDNKTGFLFDILKKDDLSDKINKLLSKPAFIRIFGANGRRRIENIISKGKVSYIIKLYKEVQ